MRPLARAWTVAVFATALTVLPAAGAVAADRLPTNAETAAALDGQAPAAAVIYDPREERILWGSHPNRELAPASLLKMATALVVAEELEPSDVVRISARAASTPFDRLQWRRGARFTVDQVLHGMLMESSNGAAVALAERVAGSVAGFARLANRRLAQMGLTRTHLIQPNGLDAEGQYSTAGDLAKMAAMVLGNPWLAEVVDTYSYDVPWPDGGSATFHNLNHYLGRDETAVGVKNGYTTLAGNTVAAAATRNGRTHIVVVLNGPDVYGLAKRLMDVAFTVAPPPPIPAGVEVLAERYERDAPASRAVRSSEDASPTVAVVPPAVPRKGGWGRVLLLGLTAYAARVYQVQRRRQRRMRARRTVAAR